MAFPSVETLTTLVAPIVAEHGLDLERLRTTRAGKKSVVAIAVDGDDRPGSEVLEKITQQISACFDEEEETGNLNFGPGYTLEVSTPGLDSPLTHPRHWRRQRGRLVTITEEGKKRTVRVGALNDDETAVAVISKNGKKLVVESIQLANHPEAMVEIEFATPAADELELAAATYDDVVR
ncbi:MAG: ribosome maturation factor RimP [Corynebacterium sp.]|uniref:ribosome maturation factor RimP n=1 Tax=Corynebacterium sp. TaxID=1720 RepID=UPI0026DADB1B|nr:ribosome maturation factor RimP [Corynebacterium sp.]MDO5098013.1 ribosome maturation factor RimP [Corynebacterium sp.]